MLDLLSLIAACTIGAADAPLWQSLVITESHAQPFSLRTPDDGRVYAFPSAEAASAAAVQLMGQGHRVRFGLAAIDAKRRSDPDREPVPRAPAGDGAGSLEEPVGPVLFEPCANLLAASKRLEGLRQRCARDAAGSGDPIGCAVAAYHGSFEHRDDQVAAEVLATAAMGRLPNPVVDTGACTTVAPAQAAAVPAPATPATVAAGGAPALVTAPSLPGEPSPEERVWLAGGGGLFPAGPKPADAGQGGTVLVRKPGGAP